MLVYLPTAHPYAVPLWTRKSGFAPCLAASVASRMETASKLRIRLSGRPVRREVCTKTWTPNGPHLTPSGASVRTLDIAYAVPVLHSCTLPINCWTTFFWSPPEFLPKQPSPPSSHLSSRPLSSHPWTLVWFPYFPCRTLAPFSFLLSCMLFCGAADSTLRLASVACQLLLHCSRTPADPSTSPPFKRRSSCTKHTLVADTTR
ncbi:hypothetical protein BDP55DRAFT_423286 [Colletotrichum godetiae]|uniref:Uncharacterized protein n=1 Tax=Colletotrichum godetiae TaxID=1209918 RepID=A0AAJ0ELJ4_9PEZI|nr:uncharacterized protein BDP55DRAFT_423286 [Colletotrichum godetiae]KAK1657615.1 hypothetical protein BDP55DRAFT_423286 [Colletotrichum godetiae]